jgi:uncharacterized RDD family membrane protein YckC
MTAPAPAGKNSPAASGNAAEPTNAATSEHRTPKLRRRLLSMTYEGLLLFGPTFIGAYLFLSLLQWKYPLPPLRTAIFQLYMFGLIGVYFVWCWRHGAQTLPMKTWKFRVENANGRPITLARAWLRYTFACAGFLGFCWLGIALAKFTVQQWLKMPAVGGGVGFSGLMLGLAYPLTALFDRDRQFLHDRLAGTRLTALY